MKRFLTFLSLTALFASSVLSTTPLALGLADPADDGDRPYLANHSSAETYLHNAGGSLTDETTAAKDDTTDFDLKSATALSVFYFGLQSPFDGVSVDFASGESARGGAYVMEYWNGTAWSNLGSGDTNGNLENTTKGSFHAEWNSRPTNWVARTLTSTTKVSDSLYFARLRVTSEYDQDITIKKVGVTNYNLTINLKTEAGDALNEDLDTAEFSTTQNLGANEFFAYRNPSSNKHQFGLQTANQTISYTYELGVDGYVNGTGTATVSKTATSKDLSMSYAYVATVKDESGSTVSGATVTAGSSYQTSCKDMGSGRYGCPVSTSDTSKKIRIEKSGYDTLESTFSSARDSNNDAQVSQTFTLSDNGNGTNNNGTGSNNDDADLKVNDIIWESDQDLVVKIQNAGDEDIDDSFEFEVTVEEDNDENTYTYEVQDDGDVYLIQVEDEDNHRTTKNTKVDEISGDEISKNSTVSVNLGDDLLSDEDQQYDVSVDLDTDDDIDEESESNNTREESFNGGSDNEDEIDLKVRDIKLEDDNDLVIVLENAGGKDVPSGTTVTTRIYVDGDLEESFTRTNSSSSDTFLDAGETENINLGDNIVDEDDDNYDVKVVVDATDTVDEDNESNNTRTEDEDDLAKNNGGDVPECDDYDSEDSPFADINNHFAECEIAYLSEEDIVKGRSYSRFDPYSTVTRAEFLKMALEAANYDVERDTSEYFRDVRSYDWFYDYVTFASSEGLVEGYNDDTFRPNAAINRAEALQMLMNIFDVEVDNYGTEDNPFRDIRVSDWFYDPVVQGYEDGIVEGYNADYYRPTYAISRGESAAMIYRAIEIYDEVEDGNNNDNNDDEADLRVVDLEVDEDNGDLLVEFENIGDASVDSDEKVYIRVYADGDLEYEFYKTNSSSSKSFLDKDTKQTLNLGDVLQDYEDEGKVDIKVVVDAKDDIDEESESNNSRTETIDFDDVDFD